MKFKRTSILTPLLAAAAVLLTLTPAVQAGFVVTPGNTGPGGRYRIVVTGDGASDTITVQLSYASYNAVPIGGGVAHNNADGNLNVAIFNGLGSFAQPGAVPVYTDFLTVAAGETMEINMGAGQDVLVVEKDDPANRPAVKTTNHHFHCLLGLTGLGTGVWRDGTAGVANSPATVTDTITATGCEGIYYYGEPGPNGNRNAGDQAWIYDTAGNDACLSQVNFAYCTNGDLTGFRYVESVPVTYIYSINGGNDYCVHNLAVAGGAPEQYVCSGNSFSYGSGSVVSGAETFTYFTVCAGFDINYGYSLNRNDYAYFLDSAGNDTYVGGVNPGQYSYMSGPGFFSACQGFPLCFAQSFVGGALDFDTAVIVNSATNFTNVLTGFNSVINQ